MATLAPPVADGAPPATAVLSAEKHDFPALTGLRFVLALWVVLHHLIGRGRMLDSFASSLPAAAGVFLKSGYLAVGAFFVLSGFVLAASYSNTRWTRGALRRYAAARLARVYPVYLLSLVIVAPIAFAELGRMQSASDWAGQLANYALVLQGWAGQPRVHWNTPAWSLSCEFFFYLCFPLIALVVSGRRGTYGAAAAALMLPVVLRETGTPAAWKPVLHLADFLIGIASFGVYLSLRRRLEGRGYMLYLPAAAAGILAIALPDVLHGWLYLDTVLRPLNALALVGFALGGGAIARVLSTDIAMHFGRASYSMYILHVPILWWFRRAALHQSGIITQTQSAVLFLGFIVLASSVVWRWLEEPANRGIRGWFR